MAELTAAGKAMVALVTARVALEEAMQTKPTNNAAYSRWIKAHEHMLAAAELLKLDGPTQIDSLEWRFQEVSFGCSEHDSPTCCLLRNVHDGRTLHIPGTITGLEPSSG